MSANVDGDLVVQSGDAPRDTAVLNGEDTERHGTSLNLSLTRGDSGTLPPHSSSNGRLGDDSAKKIKTSDTGVKDKLKHPNVDSDRAS